MSEPAYDAVVVGASLAGCTTAALLGRQGARVALLDRTPDIDHHKTTCTHYLQPSAVPVLERLGVLSELEEAGAVRGGVDLWTRWGWIHAGDEPPAACCIRRVKLDPAVRRGAAATPGVELLLGHTVTEVLREGDRPAGVAARRSDGEVRLRARLVVGADGRGSDVARLARVPARVKRNERFCYWAYWSGVPPRTPGQSQMWLLEPDCAYLFPTDEELSLLLVAPSRRRLPEFREDRQRAYLRLLRLLPDGPAVDAGTQESKLLGKLDLPNTLRPVAGPGLAFVGDAALAADPIWGVGCGWALQSGAWLADAVGYALASGEDLAAGLEAYRRRHRRELLEHYLMTADYSLARPFNPLERLTFSGAARDPRVASGLERMGSRWVPPHRVFTPALLARAAWANVRHVAGLGAAA